MKRNLLPYIPKLTKIDKRSLAYLLWLNGGLDPLESWQDTLPFWEHGKMLHLTNKEIRMMKQTPCLWVARMKRLKAILELDPKTINRSST